MKAASHYRVKENNPLTHLFSTDNIKLNGMPTKTKWKIQPCFIFFFSSFENVLLWKVNKIELPVLLFLVLYQFLFQQIYIFYNFLALHLTLSEGFCHKFSFFNRFTPYPRDCLFKKNCWQNPAKAPFMYQWWTATVHIYLKVPTTDYQVFFSGHISRTAILSSISNYL